MKKKKGKAKRKTIEERIADCRDARMRMSISLQTVANYLDVNRSTISRWENQKVEVREREARAYEEFIAGRLREVVA